MNIEHSPSRLKLFSSLSPDILRVMIAEAESLHIEAGDTLFRQGEKDDALYVLIRGRLAAMTGPDTHHRTFVGEIGVGESIGEMSVLTGEPRSTSVAAIRDSEPIRLSGKLVQRVLEEHSGFLLQLSRLVVRRLRQTINNNTQNAPVRTLALVSLHPGVDLRRMKKLFLATFRRIGRTRMADAAALCAPTTAETRHRLHLWLEEGENGAEYLLLPTGEGSREWDRLCVGQADRIVFVTDHEGLEAQDFREAPLWKTITANPYRCIEVLVVHGDGSTEPAGTGAFLQRHGLKHCYHLRAGMKPDYARMARAITGNSIGLVLGGGGARGFAHVGVIRALHEHGIPIDQVSGTSIGAFIAAECAMGLDPESMNAVNREMFVESSPTNDYTLPLISLFAGKKCDRRLRIIFKDRCIEDLWLPFFCISTSITEARAYFHESGRLWQAVRASLSIPGVFPPVLHDGQMLVDGGIVNNLPVLPARQRHPGCIIAVDVSGSSRIRSPKDGQCGFSPWNLLKRRFRGCAKDDQVPGILDILMASATFGIEQSLDSSLSGANLLIRPPLEQYQTLDWKPMKEIVEAGYREACRVLDETDFSPLRNDEKIII